MTEGVCPICHRSHLGTLVLLAITGASALAIVIAATRFKPAEAFAPFFVLAFGVVCGAEMASRPGDASRAGVFLDEVLKP